MSEWNEAPVALITGAGTGVGREIALGLSGAGFRVGLVGRTEATLREVGETLAQFERPEGEAWMLHTADVAESGSMTAAVEAVANGFDRLDALINNAGYAPLKPIAEIDTETIDRIYRVNAIGPTVAVAAAWDHFWEAGAGVVVSISSYATVDPFPGLGIYGAAKGALNVLTKAIVNESDDWPGRESRRGPGVRAFSIAPGAIETGMLRSLFGEDIMPPEKCLSPIDVAEVAVECVLGRRDDEIGQTILMPSP